jgi:hypothetical protein
MLHVDKVAERCEEECCTPPPLILSSRPTVDRHPLVREAFRLEWITIGWMVIEAVVAIGSSIVSGSLVLFAFGLDSVIELISAAVPATAAIGLVMDASAKMASSGIGVPLVASSWPYAL